MSVRKSTGEDDSAVLAMYHPVHDAPDWIGAMGVVTQFGGPHDSEDSGQTASMFSTLDHPNFPYCALPIPVVRHFKLRFGSPVYFQRTASGVKIPGTLWDVGPSTSLRRIADVSPVIMRALGGNGEMFGVRVTFKP